MAGFPLIQLPGYQATNALNFKPISDAIDSNRQNALAQRQMGLQEQRNALMVKQDDRDAQMHGVKLSAMQREQGMAEARQAAGRIQYIQSLPPEQQAAAWQQTLQMPGFKDLPPDQRDFSRAAPLILSKAAEYMGPQDRANIGLTEAKTLKERAEAGKLQRETAEGGKASLVPVWGKDAQGRDVLLQTRPDGSAVQTRLPEGVSVTGKTSKVDLGTHWGVLDQGGTLIGRLPKDIEGQQAAEIRGRDRGQAQVDLPRAQHGASTMIKYIDAILNDRNLPNVTGIQGYLPTFRSASVDTEERIKQVQGGVFLEAFKELKGGGAITEVEGAKAERAKARLVNLKQSDAGYKAALEELRKEVMDLYRIAEMRARGAGPYVPPPGVPTDGVRKENTDRLPSTPGWSIKRID